MNDHRFTERIAQKLYTIKLKETAIQKNWKDVPPYVRELWLSEVEMFIDAANEAGVALYNMDDHR